MALPLSSRSTQIGIQKRFPVIEFEPLLDAIEAAASAHAVSQDAQEESAPWRDPRAACRQVLALSCLGSERLVVASGAEQLWHASLVSANGACTAAVRSREAGQRIVSLAVLARLLCRNRVGDFGPEGVCRFASRSLLGHGFGAEPAPGGSSLFCFD